MIDSVPCLFWPQNIGPYNTELSLLCTEISNSIDKADIINIVRHHLLHIPVYANAEIPKLRYRAYLLVMIDLLHQSWKCECRQGRIYLVPPSWTESARGTEAIQKQKAAIRASLNIERQAQLKRSSVQEFIGKMERKRLFSSHPVSILSLYADGPQLARDLKAILDIHDQSARVEAVRNVIQPYMQLITPDSRCEHTGFLLNDIWRYIRHTWSIPYNSTPGRNMFYLVRDATRPFHPIIGIAALGSSLVQLTARDNIIGWTPKVILERINDITFTSEEAKNIAYMLKSTLQEALADLATDDFGVGPEELLNPSQETLDRLKAIAQEARTKRVELLQEHRRMNLSAFHLREDAVRFAEAGNGLTNDVPGIEYDALSLLFRAKRSETLCLLLTAQIAISRNSDGLNSVAGLRALISRSEGRQALQTLIRENKKRKVGINMMDIIICGAVPPYNYILGGKLVAMLIASPQVIYDYRQKYQNYMSMIASKMKNAAVHREPKLVFLGTTSLYHTGSSQYNRISIPLPSGDGQLMYVNYGKTLGFGSVHFSEETVKGLKNLQEHIEDARLINNHFGEGVNPKFRRVRTGLRGIGLENPDQFLNHRSKRIIYGVPLGRSAYEFLRGEAEDPEYLFDLSTIESIKRDTAYISEFWAKRWLLMRIENPEVLQKVSAFNKLDVVLSSGIDGRPELLEDIQQPTLFGGVNL